MLSGLHNIHSTTLNDLPRCQSWPGKRGPRVRSLAERLAARTTKGPECWPVSGHALPNGYVQFKSKVNGKLCSVYAHRLAYALAYGPIPDGLSILHSCDNPRCVNPAHLSVGTQADNIRDAIQKGRFHAHYVSGSRLDGRPSGRKYAGLVLERVPSVQVPVRGDLHLSESQTVQLGSSMQIGSREAR